MALKTVENALQKNQCNVAQKHLDDEWNRSAENPAKIYYQVIRDGLVATFQLLESSDICGEWDSFRYCSNAMLELRIKNVSIDEKMKLRVMHKLSAYGLHRLCGDPIKLERSWEDSIDLVVQWVRELRDRPKWYDFLDVDDDVVFRIRMIHNHLFFIKNQPAVREVPLKQIMFCLAIFVQIYDEIQGHEMYKIVINIRNVMQFLIAIVSRLNEVRNQAHHGIHRRSSVFKKLHKAYRRVQQMYSVFKVVRYAQFYHDLNNSDFKRCNASATVASFKRFMQVCGEAIKNTADTPNLSTKLSNILPNVLTNSIKLNSKYRNFSSHGFPLSHMFVRDIDQIYFYENLKDYINMIATSFYLITVYILHDCIRYKLGHMRRCQTIDDVRALIRYMDRSNIRSIQESMFQKIEHFFTTVQSRLSETDPESLTFSQKQQYTELWEIYDQKMEIIGELRDLFRNNLLDAVEVVAFSDVTISSVHRLIDSQLADKHNSSYLKTMFAEWKVFKLRPFECTELNAVTAQSYIHKHLEFDHDSTEQWRYRIRTREILAHFISNINMDASTRDTLEENLHSTLSKSRNGYYQNIFALDSKSQAIIQSLKASITGPKSSKDFKAHNNRFKTKLQILRRQDEQELNKVFQKILLNLRQSFQRYNCATIGKLIENQRQIPIKALLAIELWQLQIMEILYSSGYLGDNFCLLTTSVPMIWGKSYRNYLAHDSLSYDLLTTSDSIKKLINGFVLAFNSSELDIFSEPVKFSLDGLIELKTEGFCWLKTQADLLQSIRFNDNQLYEICLTRKAELSGRYLLALGKLIRPRYYGIPGIIAHEQFDRNRIETLVPMLSDQFQSIKQILTSSHLNLVVQLNLLQIDNLPVQAAIQQINENIQAHLMTPCVGAVLPHLVRTNNFTLLKTLLNRYTESGVKPILLITTGHSEVERNFLATHLGLRTSSISDLTDEDLSALFTEDYPASGYELNIATLRNDLRVFEHIVQNCYQSSKSTIIESELIESMEKCCFHGRFQMIRCLLESGIEWDIPSMSDWLIIAIANHHWKIVALLLKNGAYAWHEDGVNVLGVITEKNFTLLRKMLENGIPEHLTKEVVSWVVRFGSKNMLRYLVDTGVDIWKCESILTCAIINEDMEVLNFLESMIFEPVENVSTYVGFKRWIIILQDLQAAILLAFEPNFIQAIIPQTSIAKRWIGRISNLLKIDNDHLASHFHFEDLFGLLCMKLPENHFQMNDVQFKDPIQKCTALVNLIRSVPPALFVDKTTLYLELCTPYKTVKIQVDFTVYSTIALINSTEDCETILVKDFYHTADVIGIGLRSFLLRFKYLNAATATILEVNSNKRFYYIQIDSNSCIIRQSPRKNMNVAYVLNGDGYHSVFHFLPSNSSTHLVESLLRLGADPTLPNDRLGTPFRTLLAAPFPLELYKLIYQHYEKSHHNHLEVHVLNKKDLEGYTPLHAAIAMNNYEVTEFLLQNGADPKLASQAGEAAVLDYAILNRNVRIVELLLRHSPNLVKLYSGTSERSMVLEMAARINHDHIVRLLLECGADLNHRNGLNFTALKYAIEREAVESLQVMLDYAHREGVILDGDVDGCGTTGLQFARQIGACPEIMQLLVCHSIKFVALRLMKLRA